MSTFLTSLIEGPLTESETETEYEDVLYGADGEKDQIKLGSRLGVPYVRTQLDHLDIHLPAFGTRFQVAQFSEGDNSIAGAVWDAGLLVVDYLCSDPSLITGGHKQGLKVLDLGCGTGVIGLSIGLALGDWHHLFFSDVKDVKEGLALNYDAAKKAGATQTSSMDASNTHTKEKKKKQQQQHGERDLSVLLQSLSPVMDTECYYHFATLSVVKKEPISGAAASSIVYTRFLLTTALSEGVTPVATYMESEGLTLVVSHDDFLLLRNMHDRYDGDIAGKLKVVVAPGTYTRITLKVHSSLEAVGLTAAVSSALAEAGLSANVIAGYYHDHLFLQSDSALPAMAALEALSRESVQESREAVQVAAKEVEERSQNSPSPRASPTSKARQATGHNLHKNFYPYDWSLVAQGVSAPFAANGLHYSLITCGDVLYDAKLHPYLLEILRGLSFDRILFGYKKRHPHAEQAFFRALAQFCDVRVVVGGHEPNREEEYTNVRCHGGESSLAEIGRTLFVVEARLRAGGEGCEGNS